MTLTLIINGRHPAPECRAKLRAQTQNEGKDFSYGSDAFKELLMQAARQTQQVGSF